MFNVFNTIDIIDKGLFICGVTAIMDVVRLDSLGIKCILNVATRDLYTKLTDDGETLEEKLSRFDKLVIGAADSPSQNLSAHFFKMADFIEGGRAAGGIIVHCYAGVSRASTACISYLMIKQGLTLNSAWCKVRNARCYIKPNPGFWSQLEKLEKKLKFGKVPLRELDDYELRAVEYQECPYSSPKLHITVKLPSNNSNASKPSNNIFLGAQVTLAAGVRAQDAVIQIRSAPAVCGVNWSTVEAMNDSMLGIRAELVVSKGAPPYPTTVAHLEAAVLDTLGNDVVKSIEVERLLSAGARVIVDCSTDGGRKAILDTDQGDGTWKIKYEDGDYGIVEAFHLTLCQQVSPDEAQPRCCLPFLRCFKRQSGGGLSEFDWDKDNGTPVSI